MWGLTAVDYSVCVRGAAQDERYMGESDISLDLFSIFVEGFVL